MIMFRKTLIFAVGFIMLSCGIMLASNVSIHSMLAGNEILELSETRQLTDHTDGQVTAAAISPNGKYVAYLSTANESTKLCITKADKRYPKTILVSGEPIEPGGPFWNFSVVTISWAPNSEHFAISADQINEKSNGNEAQHYVLIINTNGSIKTSIPVSGEFINSIVFSPDSYKIAISDSSIANGSVASKIMLQDIYQGKNSIVFSSQDKSVDINNWCDSGQSLLCTTSGKNTNIEKISLDGSEKVLVDKYSYHDIVSPDGNKILKMDKQGITSKDITNGQLDVVVNGMSVVPLKWLPNNNMFAYYQGNSINDVAKKRTRDMSSIWIQNINQTKFNSMCVALDGDDPTWSSDCMKMAYISQSKLYVAELEKHAASAEEKAAFGLSLATEEEEKEVLPQNAKNIGLALIMRATDYDGAMLSQDTFQDDISPYLNDPDILFKPGTKNLDFRYLYPADNIGEISDPSSTPMGEIDSSYSWKAVVYADGHVKIVPK